MTDTAGVYLKTGPEEADEPESAVRARITRTLEDGLGLRYTENATDPNGFHSLTIDTHIPFGDEVMDAYPWVVVVGGGEDASRVSLARMIGRLMAAAHFDVRIEDEAAGVVVLEE